MRTYVSGDVRVAYGQLYVVSEPEGDGGGPHESMAGQSQGLCGAAIPGFLYLNTALHTGQVGFVVEVHEDPPRLDEEWEDVVEASFRPLSGEVALELWGGEGHFPLGLEEGVDYRVRYSGSRMDEAREREHEFIEHPGIERHLLQFWPARPERDRVVKQVSGSAAYWHDFARKLPRPPSPEQRAKAERRVREEAERAAEEQHLSLLRREWGGRIPSERLRTVLGNVDGIRELAPELAHALDELSPERQRAVARWAMRRAFEEAGLAQVGWIAPALDAAERGQRLPAPFDDVHEAVWDRLFADPDVPQTMVASTDGRTPAMLQQAMAVAALFGAVEDDPLRAALDALYAAAVTFGPAYGTLFAEARSAFPDELGPATA
ncbi:hypothetical protein [Streptomyces sp. MZ04]|uniref:hypothetical protein n=1 Tax=Streptomyces sp. MZ04 TaxID=2559236 RepID=UPI00107E8924|nr:hypothetical protein [Streptomyces sp. MZ04]TGB07826.1 hypothetical protein E2651_20900 [Streptomyces sp. MZ04]